MDNSQYPNLAHYLYTQKSNGCVHDLHDAYPAEAEEPAPQIDRFSGATYAIAEGRFSGSVRAIAESRYSGPYKATPSREEPLA